MEARRVPARQAGTAGLVPLASPDEIGFAIELFRAGLQLRLPRPTPSDRVALRGGDARAVLETLPAPIRDEFVIDSGCLVPKDTGLHRGIAALLSHYAHHAQMKAILLRTVGFFLLVTLLGPGALVNWQVAGDEKNGGSILHPALVEAVAVAPMKVAGVFEPDEFLRVVQRVAKRRLV